MVWHQTLEELLAQSADHNFSENSGREEKLSSPIHPRLPAFILFGFRFFVTARFTRTKSEQGFAKANTYRLQGTSSSRYKVSIRIVRMGACVGVMCHILNRISYILTVLKRTIISNWGDG